MDVTCGRCGAPRVADRPDPCLGWLPGVVFACCGHGVDEGYVVFANGVKLRSPVGFLVDDRTGLRCCTDLDCPDGADARHYHLHPGRWPEWT